MTTYNLTQNQTVALSGGNIVNGAKGDAITINGDGSTIVLAQNDSLTINAAKTLGAGYSGDIAFSDTIVGAKGDTISVNYTATLGASDVVNISFNAAFSSLNSSTVATNYVVNAGDKDTINFAGSGQSVTVNLGSADILTTTGSNDTITVGGDAASKHSVTIGATAQGTTFGGGLGTDTFTAGSGYQGGNNYVVSSRTYDEGFNAIGSCINYSGLSVRVKVDLNSGVGCAYDVSGNVLWSDTYKNMQQAKASKADGNDLTASDSYYCEIKGGTGSCTFHGGAAGDRIIWSSAGQTGLNDGQGTDTAYGGSGSDEFYWRNSPSKGVSNFGETIYGFDTGKDNLNFTEFCGAGGVNNAADAVNWVSVKLSGGDTYVYFDKTGSGNFGGGAAAVLKNDNLFADYGVGDTTATGSQQIVQSMYNSGHLVLNKAH